MFSFGVVLWEIWTLGEQPYPNLSLQEIFAGVMTGTLRPAIPPGCDPDWVQLMQVGGLLQPQLVEGSPTVQRGGCSQTLHVHYIAAI